jgi:hypothetical protein
MAVNLLPFKVNQNATVPNSLSVGGHLSASTKAFLIPHPNDKTKNLQHGAVESPEWGVIYRGKSADKILILPDYWENLVHEDSVTVTLTPVGKFQNLVVKEQNNKFIKIGGVKGEYNFIICGERKDVPKLQIELPCP